MKPFFIVSTFSFDPVANFLINLPAGLSIVIEALVESVTDFTQKLMTEPFGGFRALLAGTPPAPQRVDTTGTR